MGRADSGAANGGVDVDSRPPRLCYPRGNFSVTAGPHQWGHDGSLGPGFPPASPVVRLAVRPAFGLALYPGFLSRVSRPLRTRDLVSRVCHPSQTAHQTLSPFGLAASSAMGGVSWSHPLEPKPQIHCSRLRYAWPIKPQRLAAVKLHGVFSPSRVGPDCSLGCGFAGRRAGTAGPSLVRSCTPELTRQGIWLP